MGFKVDTYASCCEDDLMNGSGGSGGRNGKDGKFGSMTREQLEGMIKEYLEELRRLKELLNQMQKSFEDRLQQLMNELDLLKKENESMSNKLKDPSEGDIDALNALREKYKFIDNENEFNNDRTWF